MFTLHGKGNNQMMARKLCLLSEVLYAVSKTIAMSTGSAFTSIRKKVADFKLNYLKGYIKKKKGSGTIGNAISYSAYPDGLKQRQKLCVPANLGVQPCIYYTFGLTTEMAFYAWGVENLEQKETHYCPLHAGSLQCVHVISFTVKGHEENIKALYPFKRVIFLSSHTHRA